MSDTENPDKQVLEAIDHLRSRKARPDISRISAYLLKRYDIPAEETKNRLVKCVEDGTVFRVEYKGCISYRNAAKSCHGKVIGNADLIKPLPPAGVTLLSTVFNKMKTQTPDIATKGISRLRFISVLLHENPHRSHGYFNLLIDRSINRGMFTKLSNGNVMPKNKSTKPKDGESQEQRLNTPRSKRNLKMMSPMQRKRWMMKQRTPKDKYRVLDRRKRIIKKIFDPSENITKAKENVKETPKPEETIIESDNEIEIELPDNITEAPDYRICAVCQQLIAADINDKKVTTCITCSSLSHFRCAFANPDIKESPKNSWKCPPCVNCKNCKRTSLMIPLIRCSNCNAAYHKRCHRPYIQDEIIENYFWFCSICRNKQTEDLEIIKSKFFCTPGHKTRLKYDPSEHKQIWQNYKPRKFGAEEEQEITDMMIPDIKNWSVDQIYKHMYKVCPGGALSFKERNIDGEYLLKMSRVEVVQGLGLKLGPALKIYKEVVMLQKRINDTRYYYL